MKADQNRKDYLPEHVIKQVRQHQMNVIDEWYGAVLRLKLHCMARPLCTCTPQYERHDLYLLDNQN